MLRYCLVYVLSVMFVVFFFKQKTAYEMRISDWSSDVCSSDLRHRDRCRSGDAVGRQIRQRPASEPCDARAAARRRAECDAASRRRVVRDVGGYAGYAGDDGAFRLRLPEGDHAADGIQQIGRAPG